MAGEGKQRVGTQLSELWSAMAYNERILGNKGYIPSSCINSSGRRRVSAECSGECQFFWTSARCLLKTRLYRLSRCWLESFLRNLVLGYCVPPLRSCKQSPKLTGAREGSCRGGQKKAVISFLVAIGTELDLLISFYLQ